MLEFKQRKNVVILLVILVCVGVFFVKGSELFSNGVLQATFVIIIIIIIIISCGGGIDLGMSEHKFQKVKIGKGSPTAIKE